MGQDPDHPGYEARHDPGDPRQVGSGKEFGADLYALYRAGRVHFPEKAILYSQLTSAVHDLEQRVEFLRSSVGGEYAVGLVESIRGDLHHALRQTAVAMRDTGTALVQISADYAATDLDATSEFNRLVHGHPGLFDTSTPHVPRPPSGDDPYATLYEPPSLEAPEAPGWWPTEWMEDQAGGLLDDIEEGIDVGVDTVQNWWENR